MQIVTKDCVVDVAEPPEIRDDDARELATLAKHQPLISEDWRLRCAKSRAAWDASLLRRAGAGWIIVDAAHQLHVTPAGQAIAELERRPILGAAQRRDAWRRQMNPNQIVIFNKISRRQRAGATPDVLKKRSGLRKPAVSAAVSWLLAEGVITQHADGRLLIHPALLPITH